MLAVIGLGYVGLPLAVAFAEAGVAVTGFDHNPSVASALSTGRSHIGDISTERLTKSLGPGLTISADPARLASCSTFIICVPTPLADGDQPDTRYIEAAVQTIAPHVRRGSLVVLESTSYPGTTERVVAEPLATTTGLMPGRDFCVAFSPERVDPGNREYSLSTTPKVVAGLAPCCRAEASRLYGAITTVVEASGLREAELSKLLENTYRQVNIALMNELVKFSSALDIDLYEAIRCASTKPFGYQPFYPGPGVGGHCIPIDPSYLAAHVQSELGTTFRFVELAREINDGMPAYVVSRVEAKLAERGTLLSGARVLLVGVTYKRDVADMRESPATPVARLLRSAGADVSYADPLVPSWTVDGEPVPPIGHKAGDTFDAVIYLQDHSAFADWDVASLAPVCLDTRGRLAGDGVVRL